MSSTFEQRSTGIIIFSTLLFLTSVIKNETKLLEKDIEKYEIAIADKEKDLFESQLDFYYISLQMVYFVYRWMTDEP